MGNYEKEFNVENIPGGVYFYTFRIGSFVGTNKMVLLKKLSETK